MVLDRNHVPLGVFDQLRRPNLRIQTNGRWPNRPQWARERPSHRASKTCVWAQVPTTEAEAPSVGQDGSPCTPRLESGRRWGVAATPEPWLRPERTPTTNGPRGASSAISFSSCERLESTSMSSVLERDIRRVTSASKSSYLHQVKPRMGWLNLASGTRSVHPSGRIFSANGRIMAALPVIPCIMMRVGNDSPHNVHCVMMPPATFR